jgi:3-hydroxyacyl-CoA dehydrogenase/enoyl-CoA hydratase/3-hydroxybutyryl-CoA epimerase
MKDVRHEAIAGGLQHARALFDDAVGRRKLSRREADQAMELISGGIEYHGVGDADLVIEAVVEKMEVKRTVLREVEQRARPDCVLATNTSSLSVDGMAEALERPHQLVGMHFFNPVHRMPLVEVVRGARSSDEAVATVYRLALDLGKVPVVTADGPGFVVNRVLGPYLNEAGWLLADGATIEQIDRAAKAFGMPMGPVRLLDEVGLDVARHAASTLYNAFGERMLPAPALQALASAASGGAPRLGKKNGRGFYRYENGRDTGVDESVYADLGLQPAGRDRPDDDEIRMRLVLAMVNEAARTLADRVVQRAGELDLAMIMGTGFPPFTGGLLRFADTMGLEAMAAYLEDLTRRAGARFEPAPLLRELVAKHRTFYEAFG